MKRFLSWVLAGASSTVLLAAADLTTYRGFALGTTLDAAVKQAGANIKDVKVVHARPALIQELEWTPGYTARHDAQNPDPVRDHVLRFFNGQLFQVVSTYDRQKLEGMTEADLVEAISRDYGTASAPGGEIQYRSNYGSVAAVIARWEDATHAAYLARSPDGVSAALVLSLKEMDARARDAITEAARLDDMEAPQRLINDKHRQEAEERLSLEKARSTNKPNFRP